ncbi:MAG: formate dehydrogenase accessory sulfurtransferase FdhD [Chloroflexi bacterium]|nr:formate dehydrogenase accessory sulfurtransferase FdhD [Chloroflexota bacterium]
MIEEGTITLYVNGRELASLMCTPRDPMQLALGFLANEEFITSYQDIAIDHVCAAGDCVDIWLTKSVWDRPRRRIITSGCGGGVTFVDLAAHQEPVTAQLLIEPQMIGELMARLQTRDSLYARARGVHTSALSDGERLVIVAEDIGRHNTIDRLRGECLRREMDPEGLMLLATGRISSEMIHKAVKMGCPIVASRTSPTSMSVGLAREWNITLCGYVRRSRMNVYAHPERLLNANLAVDESLSSIEYPVSSLSGDR